MWLLFGAIVDCPIQRSLCDTNNQWVVIFSFSDPSHEQMSLRPFTKPHADSPSTLSKVEHYPYLDSWVMINCFGTQYTGLYCIDTCTARITLFTTQCLQVMISTRDHLLKRLSPQSSLAYLSPKIPQ